MAKDESQAQVEVTRRGFEEWRNGAVSIALMGLLEARLTLLLRRTSKAESVIDDVLAFAALAFTAGMVHQKEAADAAQN